MRLRVNDETLVVEVERGSVILCSYWVSIVRCLPNLKIGLEARLVDEVKGEHLDVIFEREDVLILRMILVY